MVRPDLIRGYTIVGKLGTGAMGTVYKAVHNSTGQSVALKLLPDIRATEFEFVERFRREGRTSLKINHPNVVRGLDLGLGGGSYYLAMEFVDGKTVQQILKERGRLPIGDAVHIVYHVALGLIHADELKIIHRDVKPDNIMITTQGVVKLADLGLAKQIDDLDSLTVAGKGLGTPHFMAPEQADNAKHVDRRADIYALGVTLYQMLTGRFPYEGRTSVLVILAKRTTAFEPAARLNPEVSPDLDRVVSKMMAIHPNDRYQSAVELVAELDRLRLHNERLSFPVASSATESAT